MSTMQSNGTGARPRRAAILLAVVLAALACSIGYQWWSARRDAIPSVARPPSSFIVDWRCLECGHRIQDHAGRGPRTCPRCSKPSMYASFQWACPAHGAQDVAYQYGENERVVEVKIGRGPWGPAVDPQQGWLIFCPTCRGRMTPVGAW